MAGPAGGVLPKAPALSQTSIISAALVIAYLVFIVDRGEASQYWALLFQSNPGG